MASKYNKYAQELDREFKTARDSFKKEYALYESAKKEYEETRRLPTIRQEDSFRKTKAEISYKEAQNSMQTAKDRIWGNFNNRRAELGKELMEEIEKNSVLNPDMLDTNAAELIRSGMLTAKDYDELAEKYDENPTMLKYIAGYVKKYADEISNVNERASLLVLYSRIKDGTSSAVIGWKDLCTISDYCSNQKNPTTMYDVSHTINMGEQWENITEDVIENF